MRIAELPREQFENYQLLYSYDSKAYYDLRLRTGEMVFAMEFVKKSCPPVHKEWPQRLFSPEWDDPKAFGLWDGRELRAVLEISPEYKSNRLRITNLFVQEGYRRRGYGTLLMTRAREIARAQRMRSITLETQSCNTAAISFCMASGLAFSGFSACAYTNSDAENHEVMMEMSCCL